MPFFRKVFLIALIFLPVEILAQSQLPIVPASYGLKNGLPDNNVVDGLFDAQDLLWLGTANGLSCFDGQHFINYSPVDSFFSLLGSAVSSLTRINDSIFVATPGGINKIISSNKQSHVFYKSLPGEHIITLFATRQHHLIGISEKGVCTDFTSGKKVQLSFQATEYFITEDQANRLFISSFQKDYCSIDLNNFQQLTYVKKRDVPNYGLVYLPNSGLLSLNYKGIFINNTTTHQETSFLEVPNVVNGFTEIDKDHFLTIRDFNKVFFHQYAQQKSFEIELLQTRNAIYKKILVNHAGVAVLLTNTGIFCFKLPLPFQRPVPDNLLSDPAMVMVRRAMLELPDGRIMLFSYRGIQIYDPPSEELKVLSAQPATFYTAARIGQLVWIGTDGKGLHCFDLKSNRFIKTVKTNSGLNDEHIFALSPESNGKLLLGYFIPFGLREYDPATDSIKDIDFNYGNIVPAQSRISHITQDQNGHYWVATDKGLFELDANKKYLFRYAAGVGSTQQQFPTNGTNYVLPVSDGHLWVATDNGVLLLNSKERKVEKWISIKENLSGGKCVAVLMDQEKRLWISSYKGLSCYIPESGDVYNFYKEDGLPDDEYNYMASLKTSSGDMYFGGLNGVVQIQPQKFSGNSEQPALALLQVRREGETSDFQLIDIGAIQNGIQLTRSREMLHFLFGFREYINPGYCKYWYRINGLETEWTSLGNTGFLRIWNLPAGKYTLEIKGTNAKGLDAATVLSIPLEVLVPFYQTSFFKFLIGLLVAGIFILFMYQRYQGQKAIRSIKTGMLNDIHDEVGSILTKTAMKAELLNLKMGNQVTELRDIQHYSREAIQSLRNLLWSISSEKMSTQNFQDRMQDWLHFFFADTSFEVTFDNRIPETTFIDSVLVRRNIILIIKELAHNALKHSKGNLFSIVLDKAEGKYCICIQDNGHNEDLSMHDNGFGLNSIRQRAKAIGGSVNFEKRPDGFYTELKF